jgi:uncharacterized protein (TIGR04255 family)
MEAVLCHGDLTMRKVLKNKPLLEAIFELRWELQKQGSAEVRIDPYYRILTGAMYDKAKEEYPYLELLPSSDIPENLIPYVVQQRFRKGKDEWPLIQIGQGIVTLNDTNGYVWGDFSKRIFDLVDILFNLYPRPDELITNLLMLRYIDSIEFDYNTKDTLDFLRNKMKIDVNIDHKLFENTEIESSPVGLNLNYSFRCNKPVGLMELNIGTGKRDGKNFLIWQTIFRSSGKDVPNTKECIREWLVNAHDLTDDWFFKIIEGDLLKEFE